jgi:hypothetical protein
MKDGSNYAITNNVYLPRDRLNGKSVREDDFCHWHGMFVRMGGPFVLRALIGGSFICNAIATGHAVFGHMEMAASRKTVAMPIRPHLFLKNIAPQ